MTGRILVVGLGLIGGSVAAGARARGLSHEVWGVTLDPPTALIAVERGLVDRADTDLEGLAAELEAGDLLFIAVPTLAVRAVLQRLLPCLDPGVTLTDGASVKGSVLTDAVAVYGSCPPQLVPGHPIAGSERSGVTAGKPDLFEGHRTILTPTDSTTAEHLARVVALWQGLGAEVIQMSAEQHDAILAATSHLPHAIAYSLVDTLATDSQQRDIFRYAAGGFRDFTRIASSDAVMWRDIMLANQPAVLAALQLFKANLAKLEAAVAAGDGAQLLEIFSRAKAARDAFVHRKHD